jgi:hypothetical protein
MSEKTRMPRDSIAAGHETTDINARGVGWNAMALALIIAIIFLGLWGLFAFFSARLSSSASPARTHSLPPEPRLQVDETKDLARLRDRENAILNNYGWVDQKAGIVRIPIERAMDIVARRGLPALPPGLGKTRLEMRQEKANTEKHPP